MHSILIHTEISFTVGLNTFNIYNISLLCCRSMYVSFAEQILFSFFHISSLISIWVCFCFLTSLIYETIYWKASIEIDFGFLLSLRSLFLLFAARFFRFLLTRFKIKCIGFPMHFQSFRLQKNDSKKYFQFKKYLFLFFLWKFPFDSRNKGFENMTMKSQYCGQMNNNKKI